MRKKLLIAAAALSGLVLLLALAVFLYIRSGRLDLLLQDEIVAALEEMKINATIKKTSLNLRGYQVTLNGIELTNREGREIGRVDELVAKFSVLDYLRRKVRIDDVRVNGFELWFEVDERGRSTLDTLEEPPKREEEDPIKFWDALMQLGRGRVHFDDRKNNLKAEINDIALKLEPQKGRAPDDTLNHLLELAFSNSTAKYEGRDINNIAATLQGAVTREAAQVNKLEFTSDVATATASGQIESFKPFKYAFTANSDVRLEEVGRVFAPDKQLRGMVRLEKAQITGTGADYRVQEAVVRSDSLYAEGFNIASVRVQADVAGEGAEYKATGDLSTGGVSGGGVTISSVNLSDFNVTGREADFNVTGALNLGALRSGRITVNNLRGRLEADPDRVTLSQLSAAALGGAVSGVASVALGGGPSKVDVQFRGIDLDQAATLAAARQVKVRGQADGTANLTFPGTNFNAATGRINARFDAAISPPEGEGDPAPAQGEINVLVTGRGYNIEKANVRSASSEISATGTVSKNQVASLAVDFKSEDMAEVQRVIEAFNVLPPETQDELREKYNISLSGRGSFTGRVEGRLSDPTVTGHLELENIRAKDETFGALSGDISFSPSLLRIENGVLVRPTGGRADFTLNAPLKAENQIAIQATVKDLELPAVLAVVAPEISDTVKGGILNGTVDLTGLPGPRTIDGTANVTLRSAEFEVEPTEVEQEARRVRIPYFSGNVSFANSVLTVQDLALEVGGSTITGTGSFNLDTYEYALNAAGKQIDLAQVSDAVAGTQALTGVADLTVEGRGKWGSADDWADVNLNATLQGTDVRLNGRDLGDAKVTAITKDGLLNIAATAELLNEPRTLTATVDLRERKTYPVSANIEFTNADLGPYLALISPELEAITGRATGTIRLGGPLLNAEGDFSADNLQAVANISMLEIGGNLAEGRQYVIRNEGDIVVTASPREITLNRVRFTGEGTSLELEGLISRDDPGRSNLRVNGELNLRLVSSFTPVVYTTGTAQVRASITGALDDPKLLGVVNLRDVGVRVVDVPLQLARGSGQIRFNADQAVIENFTAATTGGGRLSLSGGAALSGLVPDRWNIEAVADQVGVEYPRDTQTVFDAELTLQGNRRYQLLSGDVDVRRASYTRDVELEDLVAGRGLFGADFLDVGPGGTGAGDGGAGPAVALDIRINADETLVVRNNLADAQGSAYLTLRGSLDYPVPAGRILLSRGTLEFRNDRYELTRGLITLPPRRGADPIFDVQSEAEVAGYQIYIGFTGTLAKLRTTLRSDPDLPEADIVSLILTGNLASRDPSTTAAVSQTGLGLAQSLLSASLSEQLQKGARRLFGLSRFSVDPLLVGRGNDPTARVTLGQRITKDLTITYSQNLSSGGSGLDRVVLVEYRLSNKFSVVGFRNERGELGFDVRVRRRF